MSDSNAKPEAKIYLQNLKDASKEYEVLSYDDATQTATLKGMYAAFQMTPFTKEAVAKKGYKLVSK